ncbi:MAG: ribokinase [Gaiellaceae bacterium]
MAGAKVVRVTRRPRIIVVGSTMIDLIAYADPLPGAGETVFGTEFRLGFGGKGANQAVMASRLGAEVIFVNHVGDDLFGAMTRENLADHGIEIGRVIPIPGQSTGAAPIWVERDGTNRIIVVPGANLTVDGAAVRQALATLDEADCVLCQLEIPLDGVAEALRAGRNWNCPTILNPAPAAALDAELLELVDWLVPNESEFEALFGEPPDTDAAFVRARADGLIVTLGDAGAAATIGGSVHRVGAPAVEAVDTTGAGDAFLGGFAYALAAGREPDEALVIANACGALSVTRPGTQTSLPDRKSVDAVVAARAAERADRARA